MVGAQRTGSAQALREGPMSRRLDPLDIGRAWRRAGDVGPPTDVFETDDGVIIRMAVPGAEGANLALTIGEDTITVKGETPVPGSRWGDRTAVHCQEIPYGRFERTIPLPSRIQKDAARAQYKNGVLEVTLPKIPSPASRTVRINIT
jgi:HSP20 family protein